MSAPSLHSVYTDSLICIYLFISYSSCRLIFPTVLVLYQIAVVMSNLFIKETLLLPNNSLLCNSLDLIENMSQGQSTVFCTLSGNLYMYIYCLFVMIKTEFILVC